MKTMLILIDLFLHSGKKYSGIMVQDNVRSDTNGFL
jgi:hypothetical protein